MNQEMDYSEDFLKLFEGKSVGILGLGISGMSCLRAVQPIAKLCVCFDDNVQIYQNVPSSFSNVICVNNLSDYLWSGIDILITSPGIIAFGDDAHPLIAKIKKLLIPLISDVEMLFVKYPKAKYIGITGTNGKSTVTAMTCHILQSCGYNYVAGGNIGVPCMDLPKSDGYVLEISSFQLELLKNAEFEIIIITNLTPDHLDRYGSLSSYYLTKLSILNFLSRKGIFITSAFDEDLPCKAAKEKFSYSLITKNWNDSLLALALFSNASIEFENQKLSPYCLSTNAFFAALACKIIGCSSDAIDRGIKSFKGLPHRMEHAGNLGSISFVNDSKATNVESTLYAFASLSEIYWIAGGKNLEADLSLLLQHYKKIKKGYFFGESRFVLHDLFASLVTCTIYENLEDAFHAAVKDASFLAEKCTILLSPAHKSFDQFKNFEERGKVFIDLCKKVTSI
jgi:UDP-N-acetylmuramoylalanine--D-glutamate ligase